MAVAKRIEQGSLASIIVCLRNIKLKILRIVDLHVPIKRK